VFRFPAETKDFNQLKCLLISMWAGKNVTVMAADGDYNLCGYEIGVKGHLILNSHTENYSLICYKSL
jgi:hypothetical protein